MVKSERPARLIVVTGVDGCGKTTLCRWLEERFIAEDIETRVVWSRFRNYLSKPLLALTRLTGHNRRFSAEGEPLAHHDFGRLPFYREAFALLQAIDVNIGACLYITRPRRNFGGVVICERGPWDTLVDVAADTELSGFTDSALARCYINQVADADAVILIRRDMEAIYETRPALRHDPTLARRAELYEHIAARAGWIVLDNNGPLEETQAALQASMSSIGLLDKENGHVA